MIPAIDRCAQAVCRYSDRSPRRERGTYAAARDSYGRFLRTLKQPKGGFGKRVDEHHPREKEQRHTRRRLKRGVFRSVGDLQAAINRFLAETHAEPKPFTWTADPDKITPPSDEGTKR
jgi:hypothetical protein